MDKENDMKLSKEFYWLLAVLLIVQVIIGVAIYCFVPSWQTRGLFGDMFGGANALFSGFAFAGAIYALILQQKEITRNKHLMEEQNIKLSIQSFENTLFQLLKLHNEILDKLIVYGSVRGREAFQQIKKDYLMALAPTAQISDKEELYSFVSDSYYRICLSPVSDLGHYFRNLYHIVKFIDESDIPNKKRYTSIVRAQLSGSEHTMLYFNCISAAGWEKFKPLLEKYSMLENMPVDIYLYKKYGRFYDKSGYGDDFEIYYSKL